MMILVAVLIAIVILAFALSGSVAELRRHRHSDVALLRRRDLPVTRLSRLPQSHSDWWPDFERQFRAYVREHEREAH